MKILEIIPSLSSGGGERFVVDLCNEISNYKEHEIILFTVKDSFLPEYSFYKNEINQNVRFITLNEAKFTWKTLYKVYCVIKKINPDIVHIHLSSGLNICIPSIILNRKPMYVQTLHGRADKQFTNKLVFYLKKWIYKFHLVKLITISGDNDKSFTEVFNTKSDGIIYNGRGKMLSIDINAVQKEIEEYKINNNTIVVTHVARFHHEKNQNLLINSFNNIIKNGANVILLVIGNGYDSEEGKLLQSKANKHIHFLGQKRNVGDYLKCSDAFVLSSLNEAMPISLIEASACKCIPLSTPVSGSIDIIKNGINGFISSDFSEGSFEKMLSDFIMNYKNINREELKYYFDNNFSMKSCAKRYLDFFITSKLMIIK